MGGASNTIIQQLLGLVNSNRVGGVTVIMISNSLTRFPLGLRGILIHRALLDPYLCLNVTM